MVSLVKKSSIIKTRKSENGPVDKVYLSSTSELQEQIKFHFQHFAEIKN